MKNLFTCLLCYNYTQFIFNKNNILKLFGNFYLLYIIFGSKININKKISFRKGKLDEMLLYDSKALCDLLKTTQLNGHRRLYSTIPTNISVISKRIIMS